MTTIEALFDLYEALGGDVDEISTLETIPELLEEISEVAGSTIELPGVTASDNGNVLTVVDGKWAKAEASTPAFTAKNFSAAGLTGVIRTYGRVSTIEIATVTGTITSATASHGITIPNSIIYLAGKSPLIPLYQNGEQVGTFQLTSSQIAVTVTEDVTASYGSPVYGNFTTL